VPVTTQTRRTPLNVPVPRHLPRAAAVSGARSAGRPCGPSGQAPEAVCLGTASAGEDRSQATVPRSPRCRTFPAGLNRRSGSQPGDRSTVAWLRSRPVEATRRSRVGTARSPRRQQAR